MMLDNNNSIDSAENNFDDTRDNDLSPPTDEKNTAISITAILTAHGEGALASVSYKSMLEAVEYAESRGITVEKMVVLDKPDALTKVVFQELDDDIVVLETDFGDQGLVRNLAVEKACGDFIAFIDGDDLWSENWLYDAALFLSDKPESTIAHPEFNWFFQGVSSILITVDQEDPLFAEDFLRFGNYWDAMCMTHRNTYLNHPYCLRRIKDGFAFEDWHWNCQTYESGCLHKIVSDTIHFKRRRKNSQTLEASSTKSLMPATGLTAYTYQQKRLLEATQMN